MVGTAVKNRVYKRRLLAQMVSELSAIFIYVQLGFCLLHARLVFISLRFIQIQEV